MPSCLEEATKGAYVGKRENIFQLLMSLLNIDLSVLKWKVSLFTVLSFALSPVGLRNT